MSYTEEWSDFCWSLYPLRPHYRGKAAPPKRGYGWFGLELIKPAPYITERT